MKKKRVKDVMEFWDLIFRPFSKPITRVLIKTKITPNQITIFSLLVSVTAAVLIFLGGSRNLVIAGVFITFFIILDNVDGEVARLKGETSKLGHWMDGVVGFLTTELLIIAMALGLRSTLGLFLGMFVMIIFPMQFLLIYFYKAEVVKNNKPIEVKKIGKLNIIKYLYGATFFQVVAAIGSFANKTLWVLIFFAIVGNLFWMATIAVQYMNLRKIK